MLMEYYKPLYAHKFNNWDKMDHFLKDSFPKLTEEEIVDYQHRSIWMKQV